MAYVDPTQTGERPQRGTHTHISQVVAMAAAAFAGVVAVSLIDQETSVASWTFLLRAVAVFGLAVAFERLVEIGLMRRQIVRMIHEVNEHDREFDNILDRLRNHEGLETLGEDYKAKRPSEKQSRRD